MRLMPLRIAMLACVWVGAGAWFDKAALVCVGLVLALVGLGALLGALWEAR